MHTWDPERYLTYADERGRPFLDLVARVGATHPTTVVDLGCGPGNLTRLLTDRWPSATVVGVDSSAEMVAKAAAVPGVRAELGDLRDWAHASGPAVDVLVSNAALQWLPDHLDLIPALVDRVSVGGWFAFQVPGNFGEPSHTIRTELAAQPAYLPYTAGVAVPSSSEPSTYLDALAALGVRAEVWETTYLHVLTGPDPVFEWVRSTGARPTLQALPEPLRSEFVAEYKARLREAYPTRPYGVVLPFRRIFAVAQKP